MKTLLQCQRAHKKNLCLDPRLIRHSLYGLGTTIKAIRIPRRKKLDARGRIPAGEFSEDGVLFALLTDVVAAVLNIANAFAFDIETEIARHFPNECGYCREPSCICHTLAQKPPSRFILECKPDWADKMSIQDFQRMVWRIYPKQKNLLSLSKLTLHLAEEILELLEVLDVEGKPERDKLVLEATDVIEKAFNIASLLGVELFPYLEVRFGLSRGKPNTLFSDQGSFLLTIAAA